MISRMLYSSDESQVKDYDKVILEELIDIYGRESLKDYLNERYIPFNPPSFNRTGGDRVKGISGLIQSVPSLLISSTISLPATLLAALGVMSARFQKRWENKKSWLNRLKPEFWSDYMGNPNDIFTGDGRGGSLVDKTLKAPISLIAGAAGGIAGITGINKMRKKRSATKSQNDSNSLYNDSSNGGFIATVPDSSKDEMTPEEIKNIVFREFWIKLSNGEIIRLRADSEEHVRMMADKMIDMTKIVYKNLNERIDGNAKSYKFIFNDSEIVYWAGNDKNEIVKEVCKTRIDITNAMNSKYPGQQIELYDLKYPKILVSQNMGKSKIEVPEKGKYEIFTTQPDLRKLIPEKLPEMVYKIGGMNEYAAAYGPYKIKFPSSSQSNADTIVRNVFKGADSPFAKNMSRLIRDTAVYKVSMGDGDVYHICAGTNNEAAEIGRILSMYKKKIIRGSLLYDEREVYDDFMSENETLVTIVKSCESEDVQGNRFIPNKREVSVRKRTGKNTYDNIRKVAV